jgi:hypothetical protein
VIRARSISGTASPLRMTFPSSRITSARNTERSSSGRHLCMSATRLLPLGKSEFVQPLFWVNVTSRVNGPVGAGGSDVGRKVVYPAGRSTVVPLTNFTTYTLLSTVMLRDWHADRSTHCNVMIPKLAVCVPRERARPAIVSFNSRRIIYGG